MPKSRREQKRARREAKRKKKRRTMRARSAPKSIRSLLHAALQWPVMECWLNEDWEDPKVLNQVVVARRNPTTGEVYVGTFLVDRACLGVKNANAANFINAAEFRRELLRDMQASQQLMQVDLDLAAAVVKAGIDYAAQFGFRPHRDYRDASILLKDANPDAVDADLAVGGKDGKPFFVAGPYDNAEKIIVQLTRQLGPDGFTYLMPLGPDGDMSFDEGDWELADDEDWDVIDGDYSIVQPSDDDY